MGGGRLDKEEEPGAVIEKFNRREKYLGLARITNHINEQRGNTS